LQQKLIKNKVMINEDYVSFEVAKLLKEKGFDSPCMGRYSVRSKEFHLDCTKMCNNGGLFECAAPSQAMAMKWLRETHSIAIESMLLSHGWFCQIEKILEDFCKEYIDETDSYKTYEEAVEAAIKYCLENLI